MPVPPSSTTTTSASASIWAGLRPPDDFGAAASLDSADGSAVSDGSKVGCDTGISLIFTVGSTGSGAVDSGSSGVASGSGVRDLGSSDGLGSSVGKGSGDCDCDRLGVGRDVNVGQTTVPQVGRGVGDRDGRGVGEGSSLGAAVADSDGSVLGDSCAPDAIPVAAR